LFESALHLELSHAMTESKIEISTGESTTNPSDPRASDRFLRLARVG
jgi:hypothetical protein